MKERKLFWDAEGKRRSRDPYQKSTVPWTDEGSTHQFLLDYVLRNQPTGWHHSLVKLRLVSPEFLKKTRG